MRYEMTLLIADVPQNEFMRAVDMKPDYKWFIRPLKASFSYEKKITPSVFYNLINKSITNEKFHIIGIDFGGKTYVKDGVKCLSDGEREYHI